jgi:hypothetical protein
MNCCNFNECMTNPCFTGIIVLLVFIELTLKGFALWRAARNGQKGWYIALLLINTVGIFPLIYLLATNKKKED